MRKLFFVLILLSLVLRSYSQTETQDNIFPYYNSMDYETNNDFYKFYKSKNTQPSGPYGLPLQQAGVGTKLTSYRSGNPQYTGGFYRSLSLTSDKGLIIDFEYYIFSGVGNADGTPNKYGNYDGGFTLSLLDASTGVVQDDEVVATTYNGHNLGYTFNRGKGNSKGASNYQGQLGGFLSFGIDPSGTFKNLQCTADDWVNGIPFEPNDPAIHTGSDITIRGPWNPNLKMQIYGNTPAVLNYTGYPVLVSQNVKPGEVDPVACPTYTLDPATGEYIVGSKSFSGFTGVRPAKRSTNGDINSNDYRRIICSLVLGRSAVGVDGYFLSVTLYHGLTPVEVIKDYFVDSKTDAFYKEIPNQMNYAAMEDPYNNVINDLTKETLSLAIPKQMLVAFTGSTSDNIGSQNYVVRNLNIFLPYSPKVKDTASDVCGVQGRESWISIFDGVGGYSSNYYDLQNGVPVASYENLDMASFSFFTLKNGIYTGVPKRYLHETGLATYEFKYDDASKTGYVVVTPKKTITEDTTEYLYYNINNISTPNAAVNMGADQFRSRYAIAKVTLLATQNCPPVKYMILNKHVSNKMEK